MTDKKLKSEVEISQSDLKYILDVNQKAIEIYVTIGKQYEDVLDQIAALKLSIDKIEEEIETISDENSEIIRNQKDLIEKLKTITSSLEKIYETSKNSKDAMDKMDKSFETDIKKKLDEIDKNLFRLVIIFSSGLIGGLVTIVLAILQFFATKK
jgi:predicted PurR-regulated permease PerM